jgi:hypothetical protein
MNTHPVGAELFNADETTDRQIWQTNILFSLFRKRV